MTIRKVSLTYGCTLVCVALLMLLVLVMSAPPGVVRADYDVWEIVSSPNEGSGGNQLWGVAAGASNEVVAVGSRESSSTYSPTIQRWNGTSWSIRTSPSILTHSDLLAVAKATGASDTNEYWAVGYEGATSRTLHSTGLWYDIADGTTLIVRSTDAGLTWSVVSSPNPGSSTNVLTGVSVVASNDVWAVGYSCDGSCTGSTGAAESLVLHWNGTSWSHVTSPNVPVEQTILRAVSARASNDVWAVGVTRDAECTPFQCYETVTMHWDGTEWEIVASPNPAPDDVNGLFGVVALASDDAWAVGTCNCGTGGIKETMIFQWDGSAWSRVTSPNAGTNAHNSLYGIAAVDDDYIWAVGRTDVSPTQTLIERWDGTDWEIVSSPNQGSYGSRLAGVTVVPGTSACAGGDSWAVGTYDTSTVRQTLIERYSIQSQCRP